MGGPPGKDEPLFSEFGRLQQVAADRKGDDVATSWEERGENTENPSSRRPGPHMQASSTALMFKGS